MEEPSIIGDRYVVIEPIGRGGMATVFRGVDTRLRRYVALKLFLFDAEDNERLFYVHREARALASLQHPNIVQIFDYSGPDSLPVFLVMQLVDGPTLHQALAHSGPARGPELLALARGIAAALHHAHQVGVLHRDIKPGNVMLTQAGVVMLADFGLAKAYRNDRLLGLTVAGQRTKLFGTLNFMSPEQIHGDHGTHTDIFSLGSALYYAATGQPPFADKDPSAIARRLASGDYRPISTVRPDLSGDVASMISDCLSLAAADRPTAAALMQRCEAGLAQRQIPDPTLLLRAYLARETEATTAAPAASVDSEQERTDEKTATHRQEVTELVRVHDPLPADAVESGHRDDARPREATHLGTAPGRCEETPEVTRFGRPPRRSEEATRVNVPVQLTALLDAIRWSGRNARRWSQSHPWWAGLLALVALSAVIVAVALSASRSGESDTLAWAKVQPVEQPLPTPAASAAATVIEPAAAEPTRPNPTAVLAASDALASPVASDAPSSPATPPAIVRLSTRAKLEVFLDATYVGKTPLLGYIAVPLGQHVIEARHATRGSRSWTIDAVPGQTIELRLRFPREGGGRAR